MKTLKILKKTDRTKDERSRETNSEEYNREKKMAKKRPLSDGKKDEGSGTNLDRSEGCRGARIGTTRRTPMA